MKTSLNNPNNDNVLACSRCRNYGYYLMGIENNKDMAFMFCACPVGIELKIHRVEWVTENTINFAEEVLPRLRVIRNSLHKPNAAGKKLKALEEDMEGWVKAAEKAMKDVNKDEK